MPVQFFCRTDLEAVAFDPENADMDNPSGAIFGEVFYVVAEYPDGSRYLRPIGASSVYEAEKAVAIAEEAYACGLNPAEEWAPTYASYGSPACERELADEAYMELCLQDSFELY